MKYTMSDWNDCDFTKRYCILHLFLKLCFIAEFTYKRKKLYIKTSLLSLV